MKAVSLLPAVVAVITTVSAADSAFGQISSVTRRTIQTPGPKNFFFPSNSPTTSTTVVIQVRERSPAEQQAMMQRAVEFQKQRAAAGSDTAQYDLGVRYLKGDGVEANPEQARYWLERAATNGNSLAVKKLEEIKGR